MKYSCFNVLSKADTNQLSLPHVAKENGKQNENVKGTKKNKFVRPRWPYDMRPSVRAEKYIRYVGP